MEYRRANLVYDDVLHGNADIGLIAFPLPQRELEIIPFTNDELIVAEPRTSPQPKTNDRPERSSRG